MCSPRLPLLVLVLLLRAPGRETKDLEDPTPWREKLLMEERGRLEVLLNPAGHVGLPFKDVASNEINTTANSKEEALSRLWEVEQQLAKLQWGKHSYGPVSAAHVLLAAASRPDGATGNHNPRASSPHATSLAAVTAAAAAAFTAFDAADDTCDAYAMDRDAVFEMAQMIFSWELSHNSTVRPATREAMPSPGHYQVTPEFLSVAGGGSGIGSRSGCVRWFIKEEKSFTSEPNHRLGGSSFFAEIRSSSSLHICGVANFFNGSYVVSCRRPEPGMCAVVTVQIQWEDYQAFRNPLPPFEGEPQQTQGRQRPSAKGAAESAHRGTFRQTGRQVVLRETLCEPPSTAVTAPSPAKHTQPDGWVNNSALARTGTALAYWQRKWVWRYPDGTFQRASEEKEDGYRQCFGIVEQESASTESNHTTAMHSLIPSLLLGPSSKAKKHKQKTPLKAVYFFGSSHLSYMVAGCLTDEVLRIKYNHKGTFGYGPDNALNGPGVVSRIELLKKFASVKPSRSLVTYLTRQSLRSQLTDRPTDR